MPRLDLHTHTTASDGSLSPTGLVQRALSQNLTALAITDHDTLAGLAEGIYAGEKFGLRIIPGVELSVEVENGWIHLLGLGLDPANLLLPQKLADLRISRQERNVKIIERLNSLGFSITLKDIQSISVYPTLGRGHIAQVLVAAGAVGSLNEAFERFLRKGAAAYFDRLRLTLPEACRLIHNSGGLAVWAHPGLSGDKTEPFLMKYKDWIKAGLDGLESDYSEHSLKLRDRLRRIALANGSIYTGGSDFHGELKPNIEIGDGPEKKPIPSQILKRLDDRLSRIRTDTKSQSIG